MQKDTELTDIIFRTETGNSVWKGTVFALFPHECSDNNGNVTSYQHIGQHGSADYHHCIATSKLATPAEYADLKKEMEGLGYKIRVIKRQNREKYLASYRR